MTKYLIVSSIPDSIFNQIEDHATMKGMWDAMKALFEGQLQNLIIDLQQKLQQQKCEEAGNLHTHFNILVSQHKQLATMGQTITDDEFTMILLWYLLELYDANVSQIMTAVDIGGRSVMPKSVIWLLTNEYDKCVQKMGMSKDFSDEAFCTEA